MDSVLNVWCITGAPGVFPLKKIIIVEPRLPVAYRLHLVITDSFICPCRESPYFFFLNSTPLTRTLVSCPINIFS